MMTFKEIATQLGVSEREAKLIYNTALRKVRKRVTNNMRCGIIDLLKEDSEPDDTLFDMYVREISQWDDDELDYYID